MSVKEPKPEGAVKWGKCPNCEEEDWLFKYEGTYDDPDDLMCEGCIDEFHARVHEAEDAMADAMVDAQDYGGEESFEEEESAEEEPYWA